jgi:hypothetical protein
MARYNEILVGRYNKFLLKLLGMKGQAPAPQLAGDISATLNLFSGAENRYLESWQRFGVGFVQTALAANTAGIRLRNPATSNVIAVLEKISIFNANAAGDQYNFRLEAVAADLGTIVTMTTARLDPRGNPQPSLIGSRANAPSTFGTNVKATIQLGVNAAYELIVTDDQQLPLLPGDAIQVEDTIVNQSVLVNIWWRERFLEESERT